MALSLGNTAGDSPSLVSLPSPPLPGPRFVTQTGHPSKPRAAGFSREKLSYPLPCSFVTHLNHLFDELGLFFDGLTPTDTFIHIARFVAVYLPPFRAFFVQIDDLRPIDLPRSPQDSTAPGTGLELEGIFLARAV